MVLSFLYLVNFAETTVDEFDEPGIELEEEFNQEDADPDDDDIDPEAGTSEGVEDDPELDDEVLESKNTETVQ